MSRYIRNSSEVSQRLRHGKVALPFFFSVRQYNLQRLDAQIILKAMTQRPELFPEQHRVLFVAVFVRSHDVA